MSFAHRVPTIALMSMVPTYTIVGRIVSRSVVESFHLKELLVGDAYVCFVSTAVHLNGGTN